ncbi:MAG TPA: cupin domain-containing protein [Candidatus Competibacteraceae bacterium]|nr:cupin domain-containing protein [Candidatus Competibacteraceae bacterium]
MSARGNLYASLPDARATEVFETLLAHPGCRIERIVSQGQATPPGEWWEQTWDEWVILLAGGARLRCEGGAVMSLAPGDYLFLPAHCRHRVEWTDPARPTVWLAVHLGEAGAPASDGV